MYCIYVFILSDFASFVGLLSPELIKTELVPQWKILSQMG